MKILAVDTSTHACSLALLKDGEVIKTRHEVIPMQHAQQILQFIDEILGSEKQDLDALAWGCGPGSFTGLRIAASVIQALAYAWGLPVISISSMAALAQTIYRAHGWKYQLVALDARMNEIYGAVYQINSLGFAELINNEQIFTPDKIPQRDFLMPEKWYGVGNAWSLYEAGMTEQLQCKPQAIDVDCVPKALAIAELAKIKYEKGEWVQAIDALPVYLRDNICKIS